MSEFDFESDLEQDLDDSNIGLGDEDKHKVGGKAEWYKGEKGRTDRVALVYFNTIMASAVRKAIRKDEALANDKAAQKKIAMEAVKNRAEALKKTVDQLADVDLLDLSEARFRVAGVTFKENVGYSEWPRDLSSEERKVWEKFGEKKDYVFSVLVIYPTNREGELDRDRLKDPKNYRLVPWRFAGDKYDMLRKINRGLSESDMSISDYDLYITCTDSGYQKLTITQAGPCVYRKSDRLQQLLLGQAVKLYDQLKMRQMTTDELREKLGLGGGASAEADTGEDYSNILSGV